MSTRATIAKVDETDLTAIYLHFDGDQAGKTLVTHYADPAKVDALLALGGLSCLGSEIGEHNSFNIASQLRDDNVCLAYHRDRDDALKIEKAHLDIASDQRIRHALCDLDLPADHQYLFCADKWWKWAPESQSYRALCQRCGESFLRNEDGAFPLSCLNCENRERLDMEPGRFWIGRPINGITLNGLEFVLTEDGTPKEFECRAEAVEFLREHGVDRRQVEIVSAKGGPK